ncbi:MAG: hypothetical protein JEZ00_21975 [Anaerolineaceae bacterium]|nr:hypothetical protein [Anaerolineaceae bacterium]
MTKSLHLLLEQQNNLPLIITIYIFFTLAGFVFLIFIIYKLISASRKSEDKLLSGNAKARIVSLSIAVLFFPATFTDLISSILFFIHEVFIKIPDQLVTNWTDILSITCAADSNLLPCISQIWASFLDAWITAFSNGLAYFRTEYISYSKLILMLAVWIILSQYLIPFFSANEKDAQGNDIPPADKNIIRVLIKKISADSNNSFLFYIILFLGIYLSIAAIVTIPFLEDSDPLTDDISVERLDQQLNDALTLSKSKVARELSLEDPFPDLQAFLAEEHSFGLENIQNEINERKSNYDNSLEQYQELYESSFPYMTDFLDQGVSNFKVDSGSHIGSRETRRHFLLIDAWFHDILSTQELQLETCRMYVEKLHQSEVGWASTSLERLENIEQRVATEMIASTATSLKLTNKPTSDAVITETICPTQTLESKKTSTPIPTNITTPETVQLFGIDEITITATSSNTPTPTSTMTQTSTRTASYTMSATIAVTATPIFTATMTPTKTAILASNLNAYESKERYDELLENIKEQCEDKAEDNKNIIVPTIPARPSLGGNMGPFKYVASWLIQTESLALAQIVGMLGFGFLGSTVSSLLRRKNNRKNDQPHNLIRIIIQGSSAALVIFLAVKGGLTILNVAENEPNSYMLFLLCLIAAVYSEEVWLDAEAYFKKLMKKRVEDNAE